MNGITMGRAIGRRQTMSLAAWTTVVMVFASTAPAQEGRGLMRAPAGFGVEFTDCIESIGVGLLPTDRVRELVPPEFRLAGEDGPVTPIVVRTARCGGIAVEGRRARAGSIVQIGAVIVPPDMTGDINNYTLWYYTSNRELADRLERIGIPAQHVPALDYDYEPGAAGGPATLHVVVPRPGRPSLRVDGQVAAGDEPAVPFEANWWVKSNRRIVKMDTSVPQISIGTADLLLRTRERNQLGRLIGGDSLGFPALQQFNTFPQAHMTVSMPNR